MKEFFLSDLNFKRKQSKKSDVTWTKNLEYLVIFCTSYSKTARHSIGIGGEFEDGGILYQANKT